MRSPDTARIFPGTPESVPQARAWVAEVLAGSPATADAQLMASELATLGQRIDGLERQVAELVKAVNAMSLAVVLGEARDLPVPPDQGPGRPRRPGRPRHLRLASSEGRSR